MAAGVTGPITNTATRSSPTTQTPTTTATATDNLAQSIPTQDLQVDKKDLTDPVYAGNTYLYELVVTNTGPSDTFNVVITDTLAAQ